MAGGEKKADGNGQIDWTKFSSQSIQWANDQKFTLINLNQTNQAILKSGAKLTVNQPNSA
ncbi:hypothetical protein BWK47_10345 [Synechocystis sp. CACIAM 05]|jgi:hypothetical protein|nr:hypothetical protein BWK47_10345 [Synechocystis sp. CACIAM 05]